MSSMYIYEAYTIDELPPKAQRKVIESERAFRRNNPQHCDDGISLDEWTSRDTIYGDLMQWQELFTQSGQKLSEAMANKPLTTE